MNTKAIALALALLLVASVAFSDVIQPGLGNRFDSLKLRTGPPAVAPPPQPQELSCATVAECLACIDKRLVNGIFGAASRECRFTSAGAGVAATSSANALDEAEISALIRDVLNKWRGELGLPALNPNAQLDAFAAESAKEEAGKDDFGSASELQEKVSDAGFTYNNNSGSSIALSSSDTSRDAANRFSSRIGSRGISYRDSYKGSFLNDSQYTDIGVGVGITAKKDKYYFGIIFAKNPGAAAAGFGATLIGLSVIGRINEQRASMSIGKLNDNIDLMNVALNISRGSLAKGSIQPMSNSDRASLSSSFDSYYHQTIGISPGTDDFCPGINIKDNISVAECYMKYYSGSDWQWAKENLFLRPDVTVASSGVAVGEGKIYITVIVAVPKAAQAAPPNAAPASAASYSARLISVDKDMISSDKFEPGGPAGLKNDFEFELKVRIPRANTIKTIQLTERRNGSIPSGANWYTDSGNILGVASGDGVKLNQAGKTDNLNIALEANKEYIFHIYAQPIGHYATVDNPKNDFHSGWFDIVFEDGSSSSQFPDIPSAAMYPNK